MFLHDELNQRLQACPACDTGRYLDGNNQRPAAHVIVTSIGSIIASKLNHPLTRQQMQYRHTRNASPNGAPMTDIFDGNLYKSLVNQQYFGNPDDVAIGLFIDGFTPFKNSPFKATLVNMVIYNIHPNDRYGKSIIQWYIHISNVLLLLYYRYKTHNLHQIIITHGAKKAINIHTFLYPLYNELQRLSTHGIQVTVGNEIISARIHLLTFTGDIPAVSDLVNHRGHTHHHGCRMCNVKGMNGLFGSSHGMYFPGATSASTIHSLETYQQPLQQVRKNIYGNANVVCDTQLLFY